MQQKQILPDRLNKLTKRIKSYAFMRIFMNESQSPKRYNKLRHYDLELQGAMAVYGWLKKKLQQVYIRGYYRLKDYNESPKSSPKLVSQPQSPSIPSLLKLQSTSKRVRCQTDRQAYQKQKQSYKVNSSVKENSRKVYRSEYGGEGLGSETDRKSGLKDLLNKVRQVNSQSRVINKENSVGRENYGSRVGYSTAYEQDFVKYRHHTNKSSLQQTKRGNELSFCTYGHHEQTVRKQVTQTPHDKSISYMNIQNQASMDKNNLLSLKKWHRRQKRAIIIQKISELQNSLYAQYSRQDQIPYSNQEQWQYSQGNYSGLYRMPTNYSQVYLQRARQPTRSVMDVRVGRK